MASQIRAPKPQKKGPDSPATRRTPAWTGGRASSTFSPGPSPARLPNPAQAGTPTGQSQAAFPPLSSGNPQDKVLQALTGLIGTTITLVTKTAQRYEGSVASTSGEGDTKGVTLRGVREISNLDAPSKEHIFIASTNILDWSSGPADAKAPNGDSFKIDTDISQKMAPRRERELQAWVPDSASSAGNAAGGGQQHQDDITFGTGASGHTSWDQFAANEKLFGVKPVFDEDQYTTKIDRSGADYKDRERKAQQIANEILTSMTNNAHVAEERVMNAAQGAPGGDQNEEDKYGAVVRGQNAYVPPGARKPGTTNGKLPEVPKVAVNAPDGSAVQPAEVPSASSSKAPSPAPPAATAAAAAATNKPPADAFREFVTNEKQRLTQRRQAMVRNEREKRMAELLKFSQSFKLNQPIPDDLVNILAKDEDKQRQIREKSAADAASSQARAIGATAPAPAKVNASQSANKLAAGTPAKPAAAAIPASSTTAGALNKAAAPAAAGTKRPNMYIQSIPPFKGKKAEAAKPAAASSSTAAPSGTTSNGKSASPPAGTSSATPKGGLAPPAKLNVNASSFRPNPNAAAFTPTSPNVAASPLSKKPEVRFAEPTQQQQPNPFFGPKPIKRQAVQIKDAFNPFHHSKVAEAPSINALWPYSGKRHSLMFPPAAQQPQTHSPMVPPAPAPIPPPSYEEDSAQQAAARGYIYGQYPYPYPVQPMMPGMAAPPPGAMYPPYMQPMPYPPTMPPPNMYASPQMGQMPPHGAFMPPPPGQYPPPPPNGGGPRPSMPPTPIPAHAHPYYHQSPQRAPVSSPGDVGKAGAVAVALPASSAYPPPMLTHYVYPAVPHAMPYQMVMPGMPPPPPVQGANMNAGPPPPHGYEGPGQPPQAVPQGAPPPVQMGGVGHA